MLSLLLYVSDKAVPIQWTGHYYLACNKKKLFQHFNLEYNTLSYITVIYYNRNVTNHKRHIFIYLFTFYIFI